MDIKMKKMFYMPRLTLDIFREKYGSDYVSEKTFKDVHLYPQFSADISAVYVTVDKVSDKDGDFLRACCGLHTPTVTRVYKNFECNWKGFHSACKWLDEQREQFARSLL